MSLVEVPVLTLCSVDPVLRGSAAALRQDVFPGLGRLVERRPSPVVLALPVAAEPLPVVS